MCPWTCTKGHYQGAKTALYWFGIKARGQTTRGWKTLKPLVSEPLVQCKHRRSLTSNRPLVVYSAAFTENKMSEPIPGLFLWHTSAAMATH